MKKLTDGWLHMLISQYATEAAFMQTRVALCKLLAPGGEVEGGVGEEHALAGRDAKHAHVNVKFVAQLLQGGQ